MKKGLKYILVIGLTLIGILRFVSYKNSIPITSQRQMECNEEDHSLVDKDGFTIVTSKPKCSDLRKIQDSYLKLVKPIMKEKCLMCHGNVETFPLYAKVPPVSWLVSHDIMEAKELMDMSYDYPFQGHGTLKDDLVAIQKVVNENEMPPVKYLLMHWQSSLNKNERKILLEWVRESLDILN